MPGCNYSYKNGKLIVHHQCKESMTACTALNFIRLPLVRQASGYTCGVSCVCSLLRYAGYDFEVRQDILACILEANDEDGTGYKKIIEFLNSVEYHTDEVTSYPFNAFKREHMTIKNLEEYIDERKPVIVCIQAWSSDDEPHYISDYDDGHYVIACGYDKDNFYFMDPSTPATYAYIPKAEFEIRWHDMDKEGTVDQFGIIVEVKDDYNPDVFYHIG